MAQPYSDDLRCKFLEAYESGAGSLRELARQFRVSLSYGKKIRGQQKRTGQKERPAHKVQGVRQLIEASGAKLLYLPPYSPDFNPIEKAWSKLKQLLRAAKARTAEVLEQAVAEVLKAITVENAAAWFRHCGYGIQQP